VERLVLGVPVVAAAARQGEGIPELLSAMADVAWGRFTCKPHRYPYRIPGLDQAISQVRERLDKAFPGVPHQDWIATRLLEGDQAIIDAVNTGELGELKQDHFATSEPES